MNVYEQLNEGMRVLIQHENYFKSMLLAEIIVLIDNLQPCTYNAEPEVADSLHLSLDQLKALIARIQDDSVINADAVRGIEQQVRDLAIKNDLRRPKQRSFLSRFTSPTVATPATPVAASTPVPSSSPAPFVSVQAVRPERTWMDPLRRMFTPRDKEWDGYSQDKGVPDKFLRHQVPEAQPVNPDKQLYRIGGRKTRRKV